MGVEKNLLPKFIDWAVSVSKIKRTLYLQKGWNGVVL
jgi:hypothetical protein